MHFIYVMREQDKDYLISKGYSLLKTNKDNCVWVFENKMSDELVFSEFEFPHILSDVLTF